MPFFLIYKAIAKNFQKSGTTVLEQSIEEGFSLIPSIYKVVYINIKDLPAGYAATLLSNLPKMRIWVGQNHTSKDVQPSIIL